MTESSILYIQKYIIKNEKLISMDYEEKDLNISSHLSYNSHLNMNCYVVEYNGTFSNLISLHNKNIYQYPIFSDAPIVYGRHNCKVREDMFEVNINSNGVEYQIFVDKDMRFAYHKEKNSGYVIKNGKIEEEYHFKDGYYSIDKKNNNIIQYKDNYIIEGKFTENKKYSGCIFMDRIITYYSVCKDEEKDVYKSNYDEHGIMRYLLDKDNNELCTYYSSNSGMFIESVHPIIIDQFNPKYSDQYLQIWARDIYEKIDSKNIQITRTVFKI